MQYKEGDQKEDGAEWNVTDAVVTVHKLQKFRENVIATSWMDCSQHVWLPKHNKGEMKQKADCSCDATANLCLNPCRGGNSVVFLCIFTSWMSKFHQFKNYLAFSNSAT